MRALLGVFLVALLVGCGGPAITFPPSAAPPTTMAPTPPPLPVATPNAPGTTLPATLAPVSSPAVVEQTPSSINPDEVRRLNVGDIAYVATDGLRARSKPWVGDDSLMYWPLLEAGRPVTIVAGPMYGSGYWWYKTHPLGMCEDPAETFYPDSPEMGATCPFSFTNGEAHGWVAAGDHDGTPWLRPPACGQIDLNGRTPGPSEMVC